MVQLLKQNEIENLQNTFKTHPLLLTSYRVFFVRQGHLNGLMVTPEDVFYQSARLLDFLFVNPDITQRQVDSLWHKLLVDIRKWKADASEHDKRMVAGTVFQIVRAALAQHTESCYCEYICDLLNQTTWRELEECDKNEQKDFNRRLIEQSPILCEWINQYDDSDVWLSDQIADTIGVRKDEKFTPSGRTFSKTTLLTDRLIDIIGQRLAKANKLDATPDDFRKLFSGINQVFFMTWKGSGGELRDLFKMLTDPQNQFAKPQRGYQHILESHFLDENGQRFKNLHGDKSIDAFQPIIDDCSFLLQHLTDNMTAIMRQILYDNQNALSDEGYFDDVQAAKQAGLRIQNKLR